MTQNQWASNNEGELYEIYDIQELYKEETGMSSYPQAALFVKTSLVQSNLQDIMNFANKMQTSITNYNNNPEALSARIDEVDLSELGFANPDLIKQAYSRMALNFVYAYDCADEIDTFLDLFEIKLKSSSYIE